MDKGPEMSRRTLFKRTAEVALGALALKLGFTDAEAQQMRQIETVVRFDQLWDAIQDLETRLAPGGSFARKLESSATSRGEVDAIFRYINAVQTKMDLLKIFPDVPDHDKRAKQRIPTPLDRLKGVNQIQLTVPVPRKGGVTINTAQICTGYYVAFGGDNTFFVTNDHCVQGTIENAQGQFKRFETGGEDLAVRYVPEYRGPALTIDPRMTNQKMQGKMMMMRSLDRKGVDVDRLSFLMRMNDSLYEKIFRSKPATSLAKQVAGNFMFIMRHGDSTPDEQGMIPPQGQSGSPVFVWDGDSASGGYKAGGTFFSARTLDTECEKTNQEGLCSPIGFAIGVDALRTLCESAKANRITKSAPQGRGFMSRSVPK